MGLPAQVQQQLDAADALQKQLAEGIAPAANEPPADPPAPPASEDPPVPTPTENPPPAEPREDEFAVMEQRYRTLQGMWQSSNARLQKAEALNQELTEKLQAAIDKLERVAPAPAVESKTSKLVTDQDAEAFGTDLIDLARRVAKEQFGEREAQLKAEIEELKVALKQHEQTIGSVAQTQAVSAQDKFYTALDTKLSTWEQIQATPECQAWLKQRVPGSRSTWNDALLAAANEFDSGRALEVFDTFLAAHPQLDPRRKPEPPKSKPDLARQVAPSKSGAATSTPAGKKTYSAAEWAAEMDRVVRMGKARQYDDATALETELNAALAEGRVTP